MVVPEPGQVDGALRLAILDCAITDSSAYIGSGIGLSRAFGSGEEIGVVSETIALEVRDSTITGNTGNTGESVNSGSAIGVFLPYFLPFSETERLISVSITGSTIADNSGTGLQLDTSYSGRTMLKGTSNNPGCADWAT
jgi:hypothetical protein